MRRSSTAAKAIIALAAILILTCTIAVQSAYAATQHTVTWKNIDGTVARVDTVDNGDMPNPPEASELKDPSAGKTAVTGGFNGWKPEVVPATEDTEYTAQWGAVSVEDEPYYIFIDGVDQSIIKEVGGKDWPYGSKAPAAPEHEGYAFSHWSKIDAAGRTAPAGYKVAAVLFAEYDAVFSEDPDTKPVVLERSSDVTEPVVTVNGIVLDESAKSIADDGGTAYDCGVYFDGGSIKVFNVKIPENWKVVNVEAVSGQTIESEDVTTSSQRITYHFNDGSGNSITLHFDYGSYPVPAFTIAGSQWNKDVHEYQLGTFEPGQAPAITLPTVSGNATIEVSDTEGQIGPDGVKPVSKTVTLKASKYDTGSTYTFNWGVKVPATGGNSGTISATGDNGMLEFAMAALTGAALVAIGIRRVSRK